MEIRIINFTGQKLPNVKWREIAESVLKKNFELSVVFVGEKRMANIKRRYPPVEGGGAVEGATNVLSFLISDGEGEIFLCPTYIRREAKKFSATYREHILRLYIHGLLHLKGFTHDTEREALKMQKEEEKLKKKWLKTSRQD